MAVLLDNNDMDFIIDSLNERWHLYNNKLQEKNLGDLESHLIVETRDKCKELIDKLK